MTENPLNLEPEPVNQREEFAADYDQNVTLLYSLQTHCSIVN